MRQVKPWISGAAFLMAALCTGTTRADVIISAPSVVAEAGSSGSFEVLIRSSPPPIPAVQAFSFDIFTLSPFVDLTGASTNTTVTYILRNDSFVAINGFPFATKTGQELIASDLSNDGSAFDIFPGDTFSLGTVSYSIAPSAPSGSVPVMFRVPGTSVADLEGSAVSTVNGAITIIPEPDQAPVILGSLALIALLCQRWRAH